MCHLQGALGGHHLVICRGFAEGKMSSALGRMVPLQGCGRQAPQCQELAGDSSRTCCCPAHGDTSDILSVLFATYSG